MGYMRHHGIFVTTFNDMLAREAHKQARIIFEREGYYTLVSDIHESEINGYWSFAVFPDGSKEGWEDDITGDMCRRALKDWLEAQRYEDGSPALAWVEVQYGDDNRETRITDGKPACIVADSDTLTDAAMQAAEDAITVEGTVSVVEDRSERLLEGANQ